MSSVVLIDYGSGNLRSAAKACERVVREANLPLQVKVSSSAEDVSRASRIVLPGVGAFGDCMAGLQALPGMIETLEEAVWHRKIPFLGICVGMQLLADKGYEHGEHAGLGWFKGEVVPITPQDKTLKVPHMGWNSLQLRSEHPALRGIKSGDHAYFVHAYHFEAEQKGDILAQVVYGQPITAILAREHVVATQFHPEKSQQVGLRLIQNVLSM